MDPFKVVQPRKYSPNSRCRPGVVFLLFLPCFKLFFRLVLTLETSEISAIFVFQPDGKIHSNFNKYKLFNLAPHSA